MSIFIFFYAFFYSVSLILLMLPAATHQASFLTDVTTCVSQWIDQTTPEMGEMTKQLSNVWSSKPHKGLQVKILSVI